MIYFLLILIGSFNAISELSNQGKLNWGPWFDKNSWNNKNLWKPIGLWRVWPFIVFTDAFHFFKTCWIACMCYAIFLGDLNPFYSFAIYSCSFEVFYFILPYIKFK